VHSWPIVEPNRDVYGVYVNHVQRGYLLSLHCLLSTSYILGVTETYFLRGKVPI